MKLKYNFVVREVDNKLIAVAVGEDNANFNGMIKLNATGKFIFDMLKNDVSLNDIVAGMMAQYDVDEKTATDTAVAFIDNLRKNDLIDG